MRRDDFVFMAVTPDKYELPIYICDSGEELAEKLGYSTKFLKEKDGETGLWILITKVP